MTGAVCTAHWRRIDGEGTDRCVLAKVDGGWLLSGQAHWRENETEAQLTYAVRCDPAWQSLSADVAGRRGSDEIALRLLRDSGGWTLNGVAQPDTQTCTDIDLSFTPATNLLPLRRLVLDGPVPVPVTAAWLVPDLDAIRPLPQHYTRLDGDTYAYDSPGFTSRLTAHPSGFVTEYAGLWEGWVDG
ncbi:putative glycolipid-binding domain-containing protein [Seohaeicola nanhaiensis]|uniref:Glycolipid-binding domain-containing protein n=1 Tax=Seohaeicola nanhaiensis TaxID=1387282 RepID=A0ABV9KPF1_9RHOB